MGLSWQQGPLAPGAVGRFLVPDPLPERLLGDIADGVLEAGQYTTSHRDLGTTTWYTVRGGEQSKHRAPRWYVPRADVDESALIAVETQTFCPYKGLCSYYDGVDRDLSVDEAPPGGRL